MDNSSIVVAVITTVGGIIAALIMSLKKENREDHALVTEQIRSVHKTVIRLGDKLDKHIDWHLEGNHDGKPAKRDRAEQA
jgi:hypothetical protein